MVNPCLHWRLLDTHRQVWRSLLWGHCSFFLGPGAHKVFFVPSKSLSSQSCVSSVIKSHWPAKSNSLGEFLVPLPDPHDGKCVMGSRTFLTVLEFIWYNCSAVCGLSARWLYGGVNCDLLQEGLCHMLCDPGLQHPEPLTPGQATVEPCLCRRYWHIQRLVWLSLCGVSGSWCTQGFVWALQTYLAGMGFDSKHDCAPPIILWGFSFALGHIVFLFSFFLWYPTFSCWLFSSELQFCSSHRRRWMYVLLLCHLAPSMKRQKKKYDTERQTSQLGRCPICYWRRVEK